LRPFGESGWLWGRSRGTLGTVTLVHEFCRRHVVPLSLVATGLLSALILLPRLGAFPLWDPWEPHFAQVAWEMAGKGTWLDPYYRGHTNWSSKPIFMLWMLRTSFLFFWDSTHHFMEHEWAARFPFALWAIVGVMLTTDWVGRLFGRRAGFIAGCVLATAPQYVLIGRQVMADMVMVVSYSAAMGYLAVALFAESPTITLSEVGRSRVTSILRERVPLIAFWSLLAISVLTKGFLPPVLVILVLLSYLAATYRKRAVSCPSPAGGWLKYCLVRGIGTALVVGLLWFSIRTLAAPTRWTVEQRELLIFGLVVTSLLPLTWLFRALPPVRHALSLVSAMGTIWGFPLFLLIAAPWYIHITLRRGWPYWENFIFFHHLGRAAGTINLPSGSFEYYLRQLGFALFPWTGLLLVAGVMFLAEVGVTGGRRQRRFLFVALLALVPTAFFMLSKTKFGHYAFPVVPALAAIVGVGSDGLLGTAKGGTPLRVRVKPSLVGLFLTLTTTVLLLDIADDHKHLLRLFTSYANRATPFAYQPKLTIITLCLPALVAGMALVFARRFRLYHGLGILLSAVGLSCHLAWVAMPSVIGAYTYEPVVAAYRALGGPKARLGQYVTWGSPERSVVFLSENRVEHLSSDPVTTVFLTQPGRKFVIVEKSRLAELRRLAEKLKVPLYVVFDQHPTARLLSTEPGQLPKSNRPFLSELPKDATPLEGNYEGKLRLLGYHIVSNVVHPGEVIPITLYFEALRPIEKEYQILTLIASPDKKVPARIDARHEPAEGRYPTRLWGEGQIVADRFLITVPKDYPAPSFYLWIGVGRDETPLSLANAPPNDKAGRVRGPIFVVR
jgi:4-amino-4-deoxy-L-arabinose transferase-like glycosyltransferase